MLPWLRMARRGRKSGLGSASPQWAGWPRRRDGSKIMSRRARRATDSFPTWRHMVARFGRCTLWRNYTAPGWTWFQACLGSHVSTLNDTGPVTSLRARYARTRQSNPSPNSGFTAKLALANSSDCRRRNSKGCLLQSPQTARNLEAAAVGWSPQ